MRLKYIVPALGLTALASPVAQAVDVGGLTIGGFTDAWLQISSYDDDNAPGVDSDGEPDDLVIDFAAEVELQVGYSIGDDVHAQIDVEFYGDGGSYLETATITWDITDKVSITAGEFVDWLGWEAADAPGRYRFNRTVLVSEGNFYGAKTVTGVGVGISASEEVGVSIFVTDMIYGDGDDKENADLALGGDVSWDIEGYGNVNFEFGYDVNNATVFNDGDFDGDGVADAQEEDVIHIGANTTYTGTEKLTIGAEVHWLDYDVASSFGLMVLGNYQFAENASGTLQFAYLEPNDDDDMGGLDDEVFEVTAAVLTTPTGDANFAVNYELSFISRGDEGADLEQDEVNAWVEFLAIIP